MSILSRAITVALLILGLVALWLGLKLFHQREEIKGRTQILENGVIKMAANIESESSTNLVDKNLPTIKISADQLKRFYYLDPATGRKLTTGVNTVDGVISNLIGKSAVQLIHLNDLRDSLKLTQNDLEKNKLKLKDTETALDDCNKQKKEQEDAIAGLNRDIDQKKQENSDLKEQKDRLDQKIEEQNAKIAKLDDEKEKLTTTIDAQKRYITKIEDQLRGGTAQLVPGLQGQILIVNSDWNFVIMDIPPASHLIANTDLIVQRDASLVGKVHVTEVRPNDHFAVADIMPDWLQKPIKSGDYVFF